MFSQVTVIGSEGFVLSKFGSKQDPKLNSVDGVLHLAEVI